MSSVSIDRIDLSDPLPEPIADLSLERPASGGKWSGHSIEVSGWVLGKSSVPTAVEVLHAGRPIRRLPVELRRLDVAQQFPDRPGAAKSGFTGIVSTLGLPADLRLKIAVLLGDGSRGTVASVVGRRSPLEIEFDPALQPLMVTTLGRMASTWVMSLLAVHPQIVALRQYPYECKVAKYWLQVLAALSEPAMQPVDVARVHADRWWVGANPFFMPDLAREPRPGLGLYTERLAELCQRNIDSWYLELAHCQVKEDVRYFAEKLTPNHLQPVMCELYPSAKEIFLVRDFRDWICSILSLDAQRGFPGCGRRENEPTEAYVRRHARYAFDLHAHWENRGRSAHLVRYENLVREPEPTLARLFDFLGLDSHPTTIEALLREARTDSRSYPYHRTSASARESVGRWRRDLTTPMRDLVQELFADVLETFGYAERTAVEGQPVANPHGGPGRATPSGLGGGGG